MDIVLERILSLIPHKENGDFVHGEIKKFANNIGLKSGNLISDWINGRSASYKSYVYEIASKYDVSVEWLLGKSDIKKEATLSDRFDNVFPIRTKKIPLLGDIACGEPIYTNQEYDLYVDLDADIKADFALRCKGDSMINARLFDGDIVFCRQQETASNGDIVAVIIDDEATLKRIYFTGDSITLNSENPAYAPIVINRHDGKNVRILGKAIVFQSVIR